MLLLLRGSSGIVPTVIPPLVTDVVEGTAFAATLMASGTVPFTWSITGGADELKFDVDATTGVLTFTTAPDYENPTDVGANNTYVVQVTATNLYGSDNETITFTVTNVAGGGAGGAGGSPGYTVLHSPAHAPTSMHTRMNG
jgi:hypothetical protein